MEERNKEEQARRKLLAQLLEFAYPDAREREKACAALWKTFGGFDGVFYAPEEAVAGVRGVGERGARLIALARESAKLLMEERSWDMPRVYDTPSAVQLMRGHFLGRKTEAVALLLLDSRGRAVYNDVVCEGSFSNAPLHLKQILRLCLEYQSSDVFLAHNHPSGVAIPSGADLLATDHLLQTFAGVGIDLCDHIIFAGDSYYSFDLARLLERQRGIVDAARSYEVDLVREMDNKMRDGSLPRG